jgi:branched-chain amino acid aminotransferase
MDGKLVPWESANVHIQTHALHYASAVFEGIRVYKTPQGPAAFRLQDHFNRLYDSAKVYMMEIPYRREELVEATKMLVQSNGFEECYVRPLVYRGFGSMGVYGGNAPVKVAISAWPWGTYLGTSGSNSGVRCMVSSWRRISSDSLPPQAKGTANYANSGLAKLEAVKYGFDEAIMLNSLGLVTEGSGENIFRVKNGSIATPPSTAGVLRGITRDTVIKIAEETKLPIERVNISREELYTADELFFTGTASEVVTIRQVDGRDIGSGDYPISKRIREEYLKLVHGMRNGHEDWMTYMG